MCHQHHWPSTNPQWESQRPRNNCNLHDIYSLIHLLPSPPLELFKQNQAQKHIRSIFTTFDFTILIKKTPLSNQFPDINLVCEAILKQLPSPARQTSNPDVRRSLGCYGVFGIFFGWRGSFFFKINGMSYGPHH